MQKKIVDIYQYLPVLQELTEQGKEVSLLITGNSMSPFLVHERDYIFFKKPDCPLQKGDMVFYRRLTGQYVMHRICRVCPDGTYDMIGDGQCNIEHHIFRKQIFGLVTKVQRKGKLISTGNFWWEFFRHFWLQIIPLRMPLLRVYSLLKKI